MQAYDRRVWLALLTVVGLFSEAALGESLVVSGSGRYTSYRDQSGPASLPIATAPLSFSLDGPFGPENLLRGPGGDPIGTTHTIGGSFTLSQPVEALDLLNGFLNQLNPSFSLALIQAEASVRNVSSASRWLDGDYVSQQALLIRSTENTSFFADASYRYEGFFGELFVYQQLIVDAADPLELARRPFSASDTAMWINQAQPSILTSLYVSSYVSVRRCPLTDDCAEAFSRRVLDGRVDAVAAVPESSSYFYLGAGLLAIAAVTRRRGTARLR